MNLIRNRGVNDMFPMAKIGHSSDLLTSLFSKLKNDPDRPRRKSATPTKAATIKPVKVRILFFVLFSFDTLRQMKDSTENNSLSWN